MQKKKNVIRLNPFASAIQSAEVLSLNGSAQREYVQYALLLNNK